MLINPASQFQLDLSKMHSVLQHCAAAGLLKQLSEALNVVDTIGQYELYIRETPWRWYPFTLVLKSMCAILTVRISYPIDFTSN